MTKTNHNSDSLSASTNIAALSMEAQREANLLEREKLELSRSSNRTAMIAAIAAAIAAAVSIINMIISILFIIKK